MSHDVIMCPSYHIEEDDNSADSSYDDRNKTILEEIQALRKKVAMLHTTDSETKKPQPAYKTTKEVDGNSAGPTKNTNSSPRTSTIYKEDDISPQSYPHDHSTSQRSASS